LLHRALARSAHAAEISLPTLTPRLAVLQRRLDPQRSRQRTRFLTTPDSRNGSAFEKYPGTGNHEAGVELESALLVATAQRRRRHTEETTMRYLLLWILGVPIPVLVLIWLLWGH